jgi:hypothetical protein
MAGLTRCTPGAHPTQQEPRPHGGRPRATSAEPRASRNHPQTSLRFHLLLHEARRTLAGDRRHGAAPAHRAAGPPLHPAGVLRRGVGRLAVVPGAVRWRAPAGAHVQGRRVRGLQGGRPHELGAPGLDLAHDFRARLLRRRDDAHRCGPLRLRPLRRHLPPLTAPVRLHDRRRHAHEQDGARPPQVSNIFRPISVARAILRFRFGGG